MLTTPKRWLFFTAGLGSLEFEASANRLTNQAKSFDVFDTVKAFTTSEVKQLCPRLTTWYLDEDLAQIKGFGWYTWKSKLADLVVREQILGEFDGYMYLDSGCEMFLSRFSKKRLQEMMSHAITNDATLFTIPTPEIWHTKRDIFNHFDNAPIFQRTDQIQSGSWLIGNSEKGKGLVRRWEELAAISPSMTDESPSLKGEFEEFKVHRYDQAIFSMVSKELRILPTTSIIPGSNQSWRYFLRAFFFPFWWARNRKGETVIPRMLMFAGKLTIGLPRK